jgi:pyrimidine-specific ribonucleoside hydrolase
MDLVRHEKGFSMRQLIPIAALTVAILGATAQMRLADDSGPPGPSVTTGERALAVLKRFPVDPDFYCPQAAELLRKGILERYGREEWIATVIAHEMHQHVGIYTVVGAKMGVRAREILNAPTRAVHITVETGTEPPISCVIDGLQGSLGSTLAQKLIEVPTVPAPRVAAVFRYEDRAIRLSLRPEYGKRIRQIIKTAIENHGNLTPAYFHEIKDSCFDVWAEFDRREIFLEERLPTIPQAERE